jgi:hypothetical protein
MDAKNKKDEIKQVGEIHTKFYANGEKIEKVRARMKKYNKSPHGSKVREEYRDKNRVKLREYMRKYFEDRRNRAKKLGLCANCLGSSKEANGTILCDKCLAVMRKNSKIQRDRNRKGKNPRIQPMDRETLSEIPNSSYTKKKEKEAAELWEYMKNDRYHISK